MSREENALKNFVKMFWKMYRNINASVFCFSINVMIKHQKQLNQKTGLLYMKD